MIALLVNIEERFFDTQFIHPFVNDKLDKKTVDGQKILTLTGRNIHTNPIRHGGINLSHYLVNPYISILSQKMK